MAVFGVVCAILIAMVVIVWLYRKLSTAARYTKTVGEIISFKNMVPLINKRMVNVGGKYVYSECNFQGNAYVTVKFARKNGEELTRRYNSTTPVQLRINEHERSVPQYTTVFPDWRIGDRIKICYDPADTSDIFIGKPPRRKRIEKP